MELIGRGLKWIIGILITTIITIVFVNYFGEGKNSKIQTNNDLQLAIKEKTPEIIKLEANTIDIEDETLPFYYSTSSDSLYSTGSDLVTLNFEAEDSSGKILNVGYPTKLGNNGTGIINLSGANTPVTLIAKCNVNPDTKLTNGVPNCIPKGEISKIIDIPNLKGLNILGVDATFENDNIDLLNSKKIIKSYKANHYIVKSLNVVKIDTGKIYKDKRKVGFLFFNDKKTKIDASNTVIVKKELEEIYKSILFDGFEVFSFNDIKNDLDIRNDWGIIRHLFGIMGDCNTKEGGYCDVKLEVGELKDFSYSILENNNIDYMYIIPTVLNN